MTAPTAGSRPGILAAFAEVILHFQPAELHDLSLAAVLAERADHLIGGRDAQIRYTLAKIRIEQQDFTAAEQALKRAQWVAPDQQTRVNRHRALDNLRAHAHD